MRKILVPAVLACLMVAGCKIDHQKNLIADATVAPHGHTRVTVLTPSGDPAPTVEPEAPPVAAPAVPPPADATPVATPVPLTTSGAKP